MNLPVRTRLLVFGVAFAASGLAVAQPPPMQQRNYYVGLLGGLSFGGDRLAIVQFANGDTESVRGGGLAQFGAGIVWQPPVAPLSVQATVNYHVDNVTASNGDVTWSRVPMEVLAFYTGVPGWRLGGGARFVSSARLRSEVNGFTDTVHFKDTTGLVLEAGFQVSPRFWINGRVVSEQYEASSVNGVSITPLGRTSGQSFGINLLVLL